MLSKRTCREREGHEVLPVTHAFCVDALVHKRLESERALERERDVRVLLDVTARRETVPTMCTSRSGCVVSFWWPEVSTNDFSFRAYERGEGAPLRRGASCAHDGARYERDCTRASPARRSDTQREVAGVSDQAPRGVLGCARSGHRARGVCGCRCRTSSRPCSSQPTGKSGGTLRQVSAAPGPARPSRDKLGS